MATRSRSCKKADDLKPSSAYAILRHTTPVGAARASHWDLLFDVGDPELKSWAIQSSPDCTRYQSALKLPDHRREYLTYEGVVSGDRGFVEKWDRGVCDVLAQDVRCWQFLLRGEKLRGVVTLEQKDDGWRYRFIQA